MMASHNELVSNQFLLVCRSIQPIRFCFNSIELFAISLSGCHLEHNLLAIIVIVYTSLESDCL